MLKRLVCIGVVLSFVFGASMASAYPLVDLYEVGVTNDIVTNIYAPGFGNIGVHTGNYIVSVRNPSGSGNDYIQYSGYCVEPTNSSSSPKVYELLPIAEGSAFEAAAWILSQGYTTQAAAAQVAVWELTWDTALGNPYDLSADNFRLNSGVSATDVKTIYDAAIAHMGAGFDQSGYVIAHNPVGSIGWVESQDYIIPNPVPVPPSVLLLASGLLGLLGLRWRRARDES
jgi:hypothetical protein